ncbi:hypothetical protein HYU72_01520 [Candidatus Berkelbacteria bacterium]|nr:hypothetical protein [Candidatus Berkelbacteria bacterium]
MLTHYLLDHPRPLITKGGKIMLIVLGGENYFAVKEYQQKILERYQKLANFELNFIPLDALEAKPAEIIQAVLTQPFLISHRLVLLKNIFQTEVKIREQILSALKNVPQTTVVVLVEQGPLPKSIPPLANLVKKEFKKPSERELNLWAVKFFHQQKQEATPSAIAAIISYSEREPRQIEKNVYLASLWARAQKTAQIDISLVEQIFQKEPREEIFQLFAQALNQKAGRAYQNLLRRGFDLNHLFNLLIYQLRMAVLAALPQGFYHLPVSPFQAVKARALSLKRPLDFWRRLYLLALNLDFQLKTGKMEERGAAETFLLALSKEGK